MISLVIIFAVVAIILYVVRRDWRAPYVPPTTTEVIDNEPPNEVIDKEPPTLKATSLPPHLFAVFYIGSAKYRTNLINRKRREKWNK